MKIPKIKVNKANVDDILRPLSLVALYILDREPDVGMQENLIGFLLDVVFQIGGKEMMTDFTEATKRLIDEYHAFLLKKKAEQEAAK